MSDEPTEGVLATWEPFPFIGTHNIADGTHIIHPAIPAIAKSEHDRIVAEKDAEIAEAREVIRAISTSTYESQPTIIERGAGNVWKVIVNERLTAALRRALKPEEPAAIVSGPHPDQETQP